MTLLNLQTGVNALHIVIVPKLVCNVVLLLEEMVNFVMVTVDSFGNSKLIALKFKLFDGRDARIVVSKSERRTNLSILMFYNIPEVMSKEIIF